MTRRHCGSAVQALYRVFVLPHLSHRPARSTISSSTQQRRLDALPCIHKRRFSTTPSSRAKTREPEQRTEKWDEEITASQIYLVNPQTNTLLPPNVPETTKPEPRTRYDILRRLDRTTHRLVHPAGATYSGLPVCRIVDKKDAYQQVQKIKFLAKEKKKVVAASKSLKTLELNWAMDPNDLGHRLDKVKEFLSEGRKVEVILASKKRGRKATVEECEGVILKIRKAVEGVDGAKEVKGMQGRVGDFVTLSFRGPVPAVQQQQQVGRDVGDVISNHADDDKKYVPIDAR